MNADIGRLKIRELIKRFTVAALKSMQEAYGEPHIVLSSRPVGFYRASQEYFAPNYIKVLRESLTVPWEGLQEWRDLWVMISGDPRLSPQFSSTVGNAFSRYRMDLHSLLIFEVLLPMITESESFDFNEERFAPLCRNLEEGLYVEVVPQLSWVPVFGFDSSLDELSLPSGFVLRRMQDNEISAAVPSAGIPVESQDQLLGGFGVSCFNQWAIVHELALPKVIGSSNPIEELPKLPDIRAMAESLVTALRLSLGGSIAFRNIFLRACHPLQSLGGGILVSGGG